jgi:hypothetical protein
MDHVDAGHRGNGFDLFKAMTRFDHANGDGVVVLNSIDALERACMITPTTTTTSASSSG